ncbi:hypothetical protein SNEBB_010769 [Seison nebaliae]|nr:hypothetical protein SNEBB_010769 [Seison nebaliae]
METLDAFPHVSSASGVLALLHEKDNDLKTFGLQKLNEMVDTFWPEIVEEIPLLENLHGDRSFPNRQLASLVVSKLHFQLGFYDDALNFALGAGELFFHYEGTQYYSTIIFNCIDQYITHQKNPDKNKDSLDPRLIEIVQRLMDCCSETKKLKQDIGLAIECHRLDIAEKAITKSADPGPLLSYAKRIASNVIQNRKYRETILNHVIRLYETLELPDYLSICSCLTQLNDSEKVCSLLMDLIEQNSEEKSLKAYQICFDIYHTASQQFIRDLEEKLKKNLKIPVVPKEEILKKREEVKEEKVEEEKKEDTEMTEKEDEEEIKNEEKIEDEKEMKTEETMVTEQVEEKSKRLEEKSAEDNDQLKKLIDIISGGITIELLRQFLIKNNHADLNVLRNTKDSVKNSICHTGLVISNGFMHAGTTSDKFLREHLDWLGRASNWAKFTAISSLGVIQRRNEKASMNLMKPYLPKEGSGNVFAEGGSLYALGLIHVNHGSTEIIDYLLTQLKATNKDTVQHGACLGIGLAALGTNREDLVLELQNILSQDEAVSGEAAGIAIGLVCLGSMPPEVLDQMVTYAQETQHEKIVRGLSVGIALTMVGCLEKGEKFIDQLNEDKDPFLRRSAMYSIGMSYAGTANNKALQKLLHSAVSDTNGDVRRAAVESIGYVTYRSADHCVSCVSLLTESYNPHVRYGSAVALGIACASSGHKEALNLLEVLMEDKVNYVKQGALIAVAMICVQETEAMCPKVKRIREKFSKIISEKHEDVMCKFGAILGQGLVDAGGQNVSIGLSARGGSQLDRVALAGLLVFFQYWYWFPLAHFASLAFHPTSLIALNKNLDMPKIDFKSHAPPSQFAYPPQIQEKKAEKKTRYETAILSTTHRRLRRLNEGKSSKLFSSASTSGNDKQLKSKGKKSSKNVQIKSEKVDVEMADKTKEEAPKTEVENKKEKNYEILHNPARVLRPQMKLMSISMDKCEGRYTCIGNLHQGGIVMVKDHYNDVKEELVETVKMESDALPIAGDRDISKEPLMPESFLWKE